MTPVIGSAPSNPQIILPTPWAESSLSYRVRGPCCIWSTAVAHNSVSALATTATTTADFNSAPQGASVNIANDGK